jgi:hypothetical protein
MKKRPKISRHGNLERSTTWNGVTNGEAVVVNGAKERRQTWVFVAHVRNELSGEEWIEVRGGRRGESKGRSFRPEMIFPAGSKRGSRLVGMSLFSAPRLPLQ